MKLSCALKHYIFGTHISLRAPPGQKSQFSSKKIDVEIFTWLDSPCCLLSKTVWFIEILMDFHDFTQELLMMLESEIMRMHTLFCVFLESVFLCFICLYFQDFSTISNARKLGKVLKWSWSSALEHIKARIFVFNLVPYEKIEFSKKLTSSFFKNLFKKKFFFFFKKPALIRCSDKCSGHSDAIPRSISLKLRKKSWNYEHLLFDP